MILVSRIYFFMIQGYDSDNLVHTNALSYVAYLLLKQWNCRIATVMALDPQCCNQPYVTPEQVCGGCLLPHQMFMEHGKHHLLSDLISDWPMDVISLQKAWNKWFPNP